MWKPYNDYLIKAMIMDDSPLVRIECVRNMPVDEVTIHSLAIKTADKDHEVR